MPVLIETADIFDSGEAPATTSPPMGHQAYGLGDLIVQFLMSDDDDAVTPPAAGPFGETRTIIGTGDSGNNAGPTIAAMWFVGTATRAAGTQNWTIAAGEGWLGRSIIIPAGEFDSANPIDSVSAIGGSPSNLLTTPTPSWLTPTAGGKIVVGVSINGEGFDSAASGWSALNNGEFSSIGCSVTLRDADTSASETIASVNHALLVAARSSTLGCVINDAVSGGGSTAALTGNNGTGAVDSVIPGHSLSMSGVEI